MAAASSRKQSASVVDWLKPEDGKKKRLCLPKTCEWISIEAAFQRWASREERSPILWIHGSPGCGKSFLAQYILNELKQRGGDYPTIGYFCDERSSPDSIMRSLLAQLVNTAKFEPAVVSQINEELQELLEIEPGALDVTYRLWDKLSTIIEMTPAFSLIIDGVDEMSSKSLIGPDFALLTSFIDTVVSSAQHVRLLFISRTEHYLHSALHGFPKILVTAQKVEDDMERYVRTEIDGYGHLKSHREDIVASLVEQSEGIFVWAGLSVQILGLEATGEAALSKLQDMPTSLDHVYTLILDRVPQSETQTQLRRHILRWVTFAIRPIRSIELANAVALEDNMFIPDIEDKAINVCSSLLKSQDGILKPMHSSLKDFLCNDKGATDPIPDWGPKEGNHSIAIVCIKYLLHDAFSSAIGQGESEEELLATYPFLEYAALYWVYHVSASTEGSQELQALILQFFDSSNAKIWFRSLTPILLSRSVFPIPPRPAHSIHFAYLFLNLKPELSNYFTPSQKPIFEQKFLNFISSLYEDNLEKARTSFASDGIEVIESIVNLAEVYNWLPEKGDEAELLLQEALKIVSSREDKAAKTFRMTCFQALADRFKREGQYQDAKVALQSLLEIANRESRQNDPVTMFALDSLGWVCMRLGELDASAQHLQRALDIASAHYGPKSPMTLRSKITLAEVLEKLGKAEEAEILCLELEDQVRSRRENSTPLPRDSISQLNTLAAVFMQQKKFKDAVETYDIVVRDREKAFGVKHRMTLWATLQLAIAKESAGELVQALELLERLLPRQEEVLGHHPDTQETRRRIDELKTKLA